MMRIEETRMGDCYVIHHGKDVAVRYLPKKSFVSDDKIMIKMCEHILKLEFALESHRPIEREK
jgi:hypothetical protein